MSKLGLILSMLVCVSLVLFGVGVFMAWVFGGMYVDEQLFLRAFIGSSFGGLGIFATLMVWIEVDL